MGRALAAVRLEPTEGVSRLAHAKSIGSMSKSWRKLGLWSGLGLGLLVLALGTGWHQSREKFWRAELSLVLEAMRAGRYGRAGERLSRLAEHWTDHGEVLLLLGECEFLRGRREEGRRSPLRLHIPRPLAADVRGPVRG